MRQLGDHLTYSKLSSNPFPGIISSLNFKLQFAYEAQLLTKKNFDFLMFKDFNIPIIYVIPKVHKSLSKPPGRPIISANGGQLERIG